MQDISNLIREAKPLYLTRKKRNRRIKASLAVLGCVAFLAFIMPEEKTVESIYYWDLGYIEAETTKTYVEDLGLPVDDYGLLLVS